MVIDGIFETSPSGMVLDGLFTDTTCFKDLEAAIVPGTVMGPFWYGVRWHLRGHL